MNKSKNKYRHKWIDDGKAAGSGETYIYTCKHCRQKKVKLDFVSANYYDENGKLIGGIAPECKPH